MVRYVSLLGIAFLTLAAVALISTPAEKPAPRAQPEPDRNDDAARLASSPSRRVIPAYSAAFSLN